MMGSSPKSRSSLFLLSVLACLISTPAYPARARASTTGRSPGFAFALIGPLTSSPA